MPSLAAPVAGLARSVERSAVGRRAVAGDVSEFPARIALHSLSLAIARKVVGSTALVARRGTRTSSTAGKSAAETSRAAGSEAPARRWSTGAAPAHSGVGAVARKVAGKAAAVAAAARAGAAEAQRGAVGLYVAEALAVVALLGWGSVSCWVVYIGVVDVWRMSDRWRVLCWNDVLSVVRG